jgi:hypothetical protein
MRVRWRGNKLLPVLIGILCAVALAACGSNGTTHLPTGSTASSGPITITTDRTTYTTSDAIGVTISDGTTTDYYAVDGKSGCVIIQLQRYSTNRNAWVPLDPCASQIAVQAYAIAKNSQEQFSLPPTSTADPNAWDAGLYRITVTYSSNTDGVSATQEANSAAFQINNS